MALFLDCLSYFLSRGMDVGPACIVQRARHRSGSITKKPDGITSTVNRGVLERKILLGKREKGKEGKGEKGKRGKGGKGGRMAKDRYEWSVNNNQLIKMSWTGI